MTSRRSFISGLAVVLTAPVTLGAIAKAATSPTKFDGVLPKIRRIEAKSGGRLGVACQIAGTSAQFGYRENELFPMCSTFKTLAAALILHRVDGGIEQLERSIKIPHNAVIANSPTTRKFAGGEMTVAQLCEAAVTVSDNGAANLLLESFGGPPQLTAYLRSIGDSVSRLDRIEPELNESLPGDERDTTSPLAMVEDYGRLALGNSLSDKSRAQLVDWLVANKTGDERIRAGLPKGWRCGDKTGTGDRGSTNDAAVIWPASGNPILMSVYLTGTKQGLAKRNAVIASVSRVLVEAIEA
ncbi:class A beta-lactamase [Mesorhizobium sp. Root695]|jgi:beta-lactamase class A|uniref:class A beta-lactamase n=1 Tax=unclassified Mesorhizobium TaxID=325217 RepID=UPI0006FEC1C6|nr:MULTISPECIES: class A beta-lactamase [unclassified Mesorhizobium]KQU92289.1 class A beta-lactamase [Mesorhizobium sp. Root102]KRB16494.1 class A beta-lactamase [Mesorhizobium sp. Root695]